LIAGDRFRQKKKTMANVDVLNLNGDKVGSMELADAPVCARRGERSPALGGG